VGTRGKEGGGGLVERGLKGNRSRGKYKDGGGKGGEEEKKERKRKTEGQKIHGNTCTRSRRAKAKKGGKEGTLKEYIKGGVRKKEKEGDHFVGLWKKSRWNKKK